METDRLIEKLAAELTPAPPRLVARRIAMTALVGGVAALVGMLTWLELRPDLMSAMTGMNFWLKAAYAVALGAAGFRCAERLSRPAGAAGGGVVLAIGAVVLLGAVGLATLMLEPPGRRAATWLGGSWWTCPFNILALSLPTLGLALLVMRRFAPTRLGAAGAAAGLFAGGVAATVYGLHCNETAPVFVATWYTLGIGMSAGVGALLGPWALRWR